MSAYLGWKPIKVDVVLSRGADFEESLTLEDGETFSAGTAVILYVGDDAWPATVTSTTVSWAVDKTIVAQTIDKKPRYTKLFLIEGTRDTKWGSGEVIYG